MSSGLYPSKATAHTIPHLKRRKLLSFLGHHDVITRSYWHLLSVSSWNHFGVMRTSLWNRPGIVLGSLSDLFHITTAPFWNGFGIMFQLLGSFWDQTGIRLGSFWGSCWDHFEMIWGSWHSSSTGPAPGTQKVPKVCNSWHRALSV